MSTHDSASSRRGPRRSSYDVVVIGGGPAGSTVSALLAMQGHSVLLLEKEQFPRFHVGESLLPYSNRIFRKLGVFEELCQTSVLKWGAEFIAPNGQEHCTYRFSDTLDRDEPHAFEVERARFDQLLLQNARRLGVEVHERFQVEEVLFDGDRACGVRARPLPDGAGVQAGARFVVDASGRDTLLSTRLGWKVRDLPISKTAFFTHWDGVDWLPGRDAGNITISTWQHGWTWIIPLHPGTRRTSVGVVCHKEWVRGRRQGENLDQLYLRTLAGCPPVWKRFVGATQAFPVRTIADISYRSEHLSGPGFVLIGDAGCFMDPIFSSGVHLAMSGAELAAQAIAVGLRTGRSDPGLFANHRRQVMAATETFFHFIHEWYRPELHRIFYRPSRRLKIQQTVTSLLGGDVFSWQKRMRAQLFFGAVALERLKTRDPTAASAGCEDPPGRG